MFSGIVKEKGTVKALKRRKNLLVFSVGAKKVFKGIKVGDSVAIDGVCLTVSRRKSGVCSFDVMLETIQKTTLKFLSPGSKVNLEPALRAEDFLGGHFVQGHVDGVGTIKKKVTKANFARYDIEIENKLTRTIVPKGSVALDGISLTVGKVRGNIFSVYIIPHTLKVTTLGNKRALDKVNIETDVLAKYLLCHCERSEAIL